MNIYCLEIKNDYQVVVLEDESEWLNIIDLFKKVENIENWFPPKVLIDDEKKKRNDFPTILSAVPTFSKNAISHLRALLEPNGNILPLSCNRGEYFFYNVVTILDALNESKSNPLRFDDGRIYFIEKYHFLKRDYVNFPIFKIPQISASPVFVNEDFVQIVKDSNLKGFRFNPVEIED